MLTKYVGNHMKHKWDLFLDQAVFACRTRVHSVTRKSPFYLMHGHEPTLPGDTTRPFAYDGRIFQEVQAEREAQLERLREERLTVQQRQERAAEKMTEIYNARNGIDPNDERFPLEIGDWVLVKNLAKQKLEYPWYGPLKIDAKFPFGTFKLIWPDGKVKFDLVHKDRLKIVRLPAGAPEPVRAWYKTKNDRDELTVSMEEIQQVDAHGPQSMPPDTHAPEPMALAPPARAPSLLPPATTTVEVQSENAVAPRRPRHMSKKIVAIEAAGAAWASRGENVMNRGNLSRQPTAGVPIALPPRGER
jgi:hypothetical protein